MARAPSRRTLEEQAQAHGSAFLGHEGVRALLAIGHTQGLSPQEEIPTTLAPAGTAVPAAGLPAGPAPGGNMAALGGRSGGRGAGVHSGEWGAAGGSRCPRRPWAQCGASSPTVPIAQAVAPETGLANVVAAARAAEGGSAITARWLGCFAGTGGSSSPPAPSSPLPSQCRTSDF